MEYYIASAAKELLIKNEKAHSQSQMVNGLFLMAFDYFYKVNNHFLFIIG